MDYTQIATVATAAAAAVLSVAQFIAGRRERAASADRIENEASARIYDSYGSLVERLESRIARLEQDIEAERAARVRAEGDIETLRGRVSALEAENAALVRENGEYRKRLGLERGQRQGGRKRDSGRDVF